MAEPRLALIGTYTSGHAGRGGVHLVACAADGRIEVRGIVECDDPSFVVTHPRLPLAYAVNERTAVNEKGGTAGGLMVLSLVADASMSVVDPLPVSEHGLAGELPCHLAVLPDGSGLVVVHFRCATVQWLGLDAHGLPDGRTARVQHLGSGPHPRRQASAHAHCVLPLDDDIYVTDLGLDAVVQYRLDANGGLIEYTRLAIHAGAGPRHLCAAADGRTLWLCNEIDNSVSTLRRALDGSLAEADWTHTLPAGAEVRSATSEIALHPSGRWLYVGNRGHESIVRFELDAHGMPRSPQWVPSGGVQPRHFALTPDGSLLLAANRDSGSLQAFAVNVRDGTLAALGAGCAEVPAPVCVCWLR